MLEKNKEVKEIIEILNENNKNVTSDDLIKLLDNIGLEDATEETEIDKSLEQSKQTESVNEQDLSEQQNPSVQNDGEIDQSNNIDKMNGIGVVDEAEAMSVSSV